MISQEYIALMEDTLNLFTIKDEYQEKVVGEPDGKIRAAHLKRIRELEGIIAVNMDKLNNLKQK